MFARLGYGFVFLLLGPLAANAGPLEDHRVIADALCKGTSIPKGMIVSVIDITKPPIVVPPPDSNGVVDFYEPIQQAALLIEKGGLPGTKVLLFPKGIYAIARHIDYGDAEVKEAGNGVLPREFSHSNNFAIVGCNAKISVDGQFIVRKRGTAHFTAKVGTRLYEERYPPRDAQVTPFRFVDSSNFSVIGVDADGTGNGYGLELNGNVDQMERDREVAESGSHGIATVGASNYQFSNISVHHFSADGFYIGGGYRYLQVDANNEPDPYNPIYRPDENGTLNNVKSSNNARQGISIIQAVGLTINKGIFANTGRTGLGNSVNEKFRGFMPMAGVDIEPNFREVARCRASSDPAKQVCEKAKDKTGAIVFNRCQFLNNAESQILADMGNSVDGVKFNLALVRAPSSKWSETDPKSPAPAAVSLNVTNGEIHGGYFDTGFSAIFASNIATSDLTVGTIYTGVTTVIEGAQIITKGFGLYSVGNSRLIVKNNTFIGSQDSTFKPYMPLIRSAHPDSQFQGNFLFYPTSMFYLPAGTAAKPAIQIAGFVQNLCAKTGTAVQKNRFSSGLINTPQKIFAILYDGSNVEGDIFEPGRSIRPYEALSATTFDRPLCGIPK